jgi:hypothetical protein
MARRSEWVEAYRSLGVVLFVVAALAAMVISSCGGGGGSNSNGELCQQCGDTDGPCIPSVEYTPDPSLPPPCDGQPVPTCSPVPSTTTAACVPGPASTASTCTVNLICRRKSDSSQQRCFPANPNLPPDMPDVNYQWRCDGSRPGGTPRPEPTATLSPTTAATSTPQAICGNGVKEGTEQCDGADFAGQTCASFGCQDPTTGNGLICSGSCTISTAACLFCTGVGSTP